MVYSRHAHMIEDRQRMRPLTSAIRQVVRKGDTVIDIGAGTGILSRIAVRAGAKRVYAIECDTKTSTYGQKVSQKEIKRDRLTWVTDFSYEASLPQKADVLIQETIGSLAFDENFLSALNDAKRRLLKPHAKIIPSVIELWGSPVNVKGLKAGKWAVRTIQPALIQGPIRRLARLKTKTYQKDGMHIAASWKMSCETTVNGIVVWPRIEWAPGQVTDCSVFSPPTHWKQGILGCRNLNLKAGAICRFELIFAPHPRNPWTQTEILWRWQGP